MRLDRGAVVGAVAQEDGPGESQPGDPFDHFRSPVPHDSPCPEQSAEASFVLLEAKQMAQHLGGFGELLITDQLLKQLGRISVSTTRRILARIHQDEPRLPRKPPTIGNSVTRDVPMKIIPFP